MWIVSFADAAAVSGLLLLGQSTQPPTIRTGVNVVEVDVVVVDERGTPVSGLQQQDFEVREDGQPVEIATFTAVDVPEAPLTRACRRPTCRAPRRPRTASPRMAA
jgi:VWFA-related protein